MEPKFQVGDKAYYPHLRRTGTILRIINKKDERDIRRQGYRYEVSFRGTEYVWSVLESSLESLLPEKSKIQDEENQ